MAVETELRQKRSRTRSPAYPYIPLPVALEKAAVLWQAEGRHAAAVSVAMQHWGYKEESSTGYSCVAALKKFGLVDHEGMGDGRQVRLSGLALSILLDKNPDSPERRDALRAAALGPRIHAELWERYGAELPSDQSLRRFLVVERSFNETAVDELLDEYRVTMAFAGLPVGTGVGEAASAPAPARGTGTVAPTAPTALPPTALAAPLRTLATESSVVPTGAANGREQRRPELPPNAFRMPAKPSTAMNEGVHPKDAAEGRRTATQRHLFGEDEPDEGAAPGGERATPGSNGGAYEDMLAPVAERGRGERLPREGAVQADPWSGARRELPVPLDNDLVARVPYPMTEEDFILLIDTLQLWKKRLVHPKR